MDKGAGLMETTVIASQAGHWYSRDGAPMYEIEARNGAMRPTTIRDAAKLDLVPSVTLILNVAAKPGLESWKARQLLEASLTLPKLRDETLDDYAVRVIEDAAEQSKKAREKGTALHAAIEKSIQGQLVEEWKEHIHALWNTADAYGLDLTLGEAERSFASPLSYGGKVDWFQSDPPVVIDVKSKDRIEDSKQLVWSEHIQQLAAYGFGLFGNQNFRALNIFIGVSDCQIRIMEHEWPDIVAGFAQFRCLLDYWCMVRKFGKYANGVLPTTS